MGAVDTAVYGEMLDLVLAGDITGLMAKVEEIVFMGRELSNFVNEFTWYLRNLLLIKTSPEMEDAIDLSSENLAVLKAQAANTDFNDIVRFIRVFSELSADIKDARQKRVVLEVALIKLCKPQMETDTDSLAKRVEELESRLDKGEFNIPAGAVPVPAAEGAPEVVRPVKKEKERVPVAALPEDLQQMVVKWKSLCANLSQPLVRYVINADVSYNGDTLIIVPNNSVAATFLNSGDALDTIKKVLADQTGKAVNIQVAATEKSKYSGDLIDLSSIEGINMPIEIEDN